jgi:hypothetical protein
MKSIKQHLPAREPFKQGDILWGRFPVHDPRWGAWHAGLVVMVRPTGAAIIVIGTSRHVPMTPRDTDVVLDPQRMDQSQWTLTGLVKPTHFDLQHGDQELLPPATVGEGRFRECLIGTLMAPPSSLVIPPAMAALRRALRCRR